MEAETVLLLGDGDALVKEVLKDSKERMTRLDKARWTFEELDHVELQLDLSLKESPLMSGTVTLVSVATFLAGFVANDFSGFTSEDWQEVNGLCKWLYVCLLAHAEGSVLYVAICGTMACATHLRAMNQVGPWENKCRQALVPVMENLDRLKGRRLETIEAVLMAVIHSEEDYVRTLTIGGDMYFTGMIQLLQRPGGEFFLSVKDPVSLMGSYFGFKYLTDIHFPIAIVCFLCAQTLKALKGEPMAIVSAVVAIVAFWLLKIAFDLSSLYKKICD